MELSVLRVNLKSATCTEKGTKLGVISLDFLICSDYNNYTRQFIVNCIKI